MSARKKRGQKPEDSLASYREKRDFTRTSEPSGTASASEGHELRFVLHRHDASHLHWDLRLEAEGVLRSFAIPRGIAWDPKVKRLAVRTEDHPLAYESFSGVIPAGEYGAGRMSIADRGTYRAQPGYDLVEGLARGEIKLELFGRCMRGEWHLVRTARQEGSQESWLFFKARDDYCRRNPFARGCDFSQARVAALPKSLRLATPAAGEDASLGGDGWSFEAGLPGLRVALEREGDRLRVRGAREVRVREKHWSGVLSDVAAALRAMPGRAVLLDGSFVLVDGGALLQDAGSREVLDAIAAIEDRASEGPSLVFCAQDVLYYEDWDLRAMQLRERKRVLEALVEPSRSMQLSASVEGDIDALRAALSDAGYRTMLAKPLASPYRGGAASSWLELPVRSTPPRRAAPRASKRVRITNEDKVWFPQDGVTKGDVLAYYDSVADVLLPFLRDRPLNLQRFPDGIEGEGFYQKNVPEHAPDWIESITIESAASERAIRYLIIDSRDALRWAVQEGGFELHTWHSRVDALDEADYALIDLDPKQAPFGDVVRIARFVGEILREICLRPVLKTSGQSGLHILVPLVAGYSYEHARGFAEAIARLVVLEMPQIATIERDPRRRAGRVYVDFLQNRRGQTVVPPFSVRPRPGAPVSAPLAWDELGDDLDPRAFTIRTLRVELRRRAELIAGLRSDPQTMDRALEQLIKRF